MKIISVFLALAITVNCMGQTDAMKKFKKSTIKLEKIPYDIYKGTIQVRLNRCDSASGYILLPVNIIKSTSPTPAEPIFEMTGGPGDANINDIPPRELLVHHDLVMVGYRGVDGSVLPGDKKISKVFQGIGQHLSSDESLDKIRDSYNQYFKDLAQKGIDPNNFTILDVVDDFEDVRKELGYKTINIFSQSYGTRVALLYSYRYPNAIYRSLMVGVNPPGHFVWYPEMTTLIIRRYDSMYKVQTVGSSISIEECIRLSLKNMPKHWTFFRLDADKIKAISFMSLFSKWDAPKAFDAFRRAALKGDYSGLYMMQLMYEYMGFFFNPNYGDFTIKAYGADFNPDVDYRQRLRSDSFEIGAIPSLACWGMITGNNFGLKLIEEEYRKPRVSNTETLMIGGNLDISTPSDYTTKELLPFMPNSKQVIIKHMAHVGDLMWAEHNAFINMSLRFYDEGVVDTSKFKVDPINFKPKGNYCRMAKWGYPLVALLSIFD